MAPLDPSVRRLLVVVSAIIAADTALFAAIAPILPGLADDLDLSTTESGLLFAAFPAGLLISALPTAAFGARVGHRRAVLAGVLLMIASGVAFGLLQSGPALTAARFLQGLGSACSWAGGLGWLAAVAPRERRGELIGTAFGAALAGAFAGPILGGLADLAGRGPVFTGVSALGVMLVWLALRAPAAPERDVPVPLRRLPGYLREPRIALGNWIVLLLGLTFGTISVLIPLALDDRGASAQVIAGMFLVTTGAETIVAPLVGRYSDRHGRLAPLRAALPAGALLVALLGLPDAAWLLIALVLLTSPVIGVGWSPSFALVTDGGEARGLPTVYGMALLNLAWSIGETGGSAGGSALADAAGRALPFLLLGGLFVASAAVLSRRAPRAAAVPGSDRVAPAAPRPSENAP